MQRFIQKVGQKAAAVGVHMDFAVDGLFIFFCLSFLKKERVGRNFRRSFFTARTSPPSGSAIAASVSCSNITPCSGT